MQFYNVLFMFIYSIGFALGGGKVRGSVARKKGQYALYFQAIQEKTSIHLLSV